MQILILGLLIVALGIQALILQREYKDTSFKSFSEDYKYRLAKLPLLIIVGILIIGSLTAIGGIVKINNRPQSNDSQSVKEPAESNTTVIKTIETRKCNICGRAFTGDGYCEISEGIWRPCEYPYSSDICSSSCGIKSTKQLNKVIEDYTNETSMGLCTNCELGHYKNGVCDKCGAASNSRVNQSRSRTEACSLCKGTGIEMPQGRNIGGETGRICPMCNGTGRKSY